MVNLAIKFKLPNSNNNNKLCMNGKNLFLPYLNIFILFFVLVIDKIAHV
jgi:hypothetical protein